MIKAEMITKLNALGSKVMVGMTLQLSITETMTVMSALKRFADDPETSALDAAWASDLHNEISIAMLKEEKA